MIFIHRVRYKIVTCNTLLCYTLLITKIVPIFADYYLRVLPPPREDVSPPPRDTDEEDILPEERIVPDDERTALLLFVDGVEDERIVDDEREGVTELLTLVWVG